MKSKLVIVGAGSIFFTRAVAVGMCKDPHFRDARSLWWMWIRSCST
jgi:alpha-galactosidase/6-phospho-beta-glucosidase family protein